jgi:ferric enterobactin receptor
MKRHLHYFLPLIWGVQNITKGWSYSIKRIVAILILFYCSVFTIAAQKAENSAFGKIAGKIIDSISSKPIEYASISLLTDKGDKVVNGCTTDEKGSFKLENIPNGKYKMQIYFIGYKTGVENNIVVSDAGYNVQLNDIKLVSIQAKLKEVEIISEKSIIENKIDKMVYNAEQDITSQSGVAADVLKKVPQVSVDVDGNVELQGSSSIRFLINGKPSVIFGNNIADVLQSIPANQIKSIEIITSQGAKYDAQGTGGIINIILKKSTAEGVNGTVSLSAGTRLENGSLNLNAHHKHIGVNAFVSGNAQLPSETINTMNRSAHDNLSLQSSQLVQNGTSQFSRNGFESGIGFDWDISPKDNINASVGLDYFGNNNSGVNERQSIMKDSVGNVFSTINDKINTTSNAHSQSLNYELNYKRTFAKEDQELNISYESSNSNEYAYYSQLQKYILPDSIYSGSYGINPGVEKETNISIDYAQPVSEDIVIETGAKAVFGQIISKSDVYFKNQQDDNYSFNDPQSYSLNYKSNIYAGYLSGQFKLLDWLDVKTGLRYEYTQPQAYFSNSGNVAIKPYATFVPSAVISHAFKNKQTLKLSYTHRIERPEYRDLNPFINASDPKNITTGNTHLVPETGDKIELGYSKMLDKGASINFTLFYRGNKNDIQNYTHYYSSYAVGDTAYTNVAVSTRENIGRENNFGLNIYGSVPIAKKINLRSNISAFQRYIINGALPGQNVRGFNYRININATYQITSSFVLELFGNFNSPRVNAQGTMPSSTTYNIAIRKQFFNKKLSIALTATNAFNKYVKQKTQLTGENFATTNIRELPYRSFGINISYKFGRMEFKKEKETEDPNLINPPSPNN